VTKAAIAESPHASGSQGTATPDDTARPAIPPLPPLEAVERAWRCAECHEELYDEWSRSPHANAAKSELFAASLEHADEHDCNRCHAPLARRIDDPQTVAEGVTCEVCHRMQAATATPDGANFELVASPATKYGPLCDATYPYFHEADCLPFFSESKLCGSCHLLHYPTPSGNSLPVYTEYEEWLAGPHGKEGKQCQSCHMPGATKAIASGEKERKGVPHHDFVGGPKSLVGTGLQVSAVIQSDDQGLDVDVTLLNRGAGHALPGVHRQLVLEAKTLSPSRVVVDQARVVFERQFVDATGNPVPFFAASRLGREHRIGPRERREEHFDLTAPEAGSLSITLLRLAVAPALAQRLGVPPPVPQVVLQAEVPFGAPDASHRRRHLPKRIELKP